MKINKVFKILKEKLPIKKKIHDIVAIWRLLKCCKYERISKVLNFFIVYTNEYKIKTGLLLTPSAILKIAFS